MDMFTGKSNDEFLQMMAINKKLLINKDTGKVYNLATNRWVLTNGRVGKKILS
jgi:hypothetical protein